MRRTYVAGKGFVPLAQLGVGNKIVTRAGPYLVVKSVKTEKKPEGVTVYNFEVEGSHTYFVGKANGGAWVHNLCDWITPGSLTGEEAAAVAHSLSHLDAGTMPPGFTPHQWGKTFRNLNGDLPGVPGTGGYKEFDVTPAPGTPNRGPRRIVVSDTDGSMYYTWTHYGSSGPPPFARIR